MTPVFSSDSKYKIVKLLTNTRLYFPAQYSVSNLLHPNYFNYRSLFMQSNLPLLGEFISDTQLVYMETDWENLTLHVDDRTHHVTPQKTQSTPLRKHRWDTILSKSKQSSFQVRTLVRRLPYEINKYYSFTNTRLPYSSRNYMYRLLKTTLPRLTSTKHTFDEIKYVRRTKVRSLLQPVTISPTNTKSNLTSELVFNTQLYPFKSTIWFNPTIYSLTPQKKSTYNIHSKERASRINLRSWICTYNNLPLLLKSRTNLNVTNLSLNFFEPQRVLKQYSISTILNPLKVQHSYSNLSMYTQKTYKIKPTLKPIVQKVTSNVLNSYISNFSTKTNLITQLKIKTSRLSTFIFRNIGVFILSKALWKNNFPVKLKSQLKKKLFSFIYPGQVKRNILNKRKKQVLTRLLSKSTQLVNSLDKFSYRLFHQIFKVKQNNKGLNTIKNLYTSGSEHSHLSYNANLPYVQYNLPFQVKGENTEDLFIHQEVKIPRVRFKPGYQRIWRQVRSALKTALNVKFQYQKQLTKYLVKFYHLSNQYLLSYSESTLDKVILYSHLLPDMSTIQLFQKESFIYLNGIATLSTTNIVIKNDVIQLVVSLWYYIINKWFTNWTQLRIKKFKRLVYRKNKPLQYRVMKNKKQTSYYTPNWITQTRYDNNDIKPYLEVDFFTLSSIILTDTYTQHYHKSDDLPDLRNSTYLLYNWKYIT